MSSSLNTMRAILVGGAVIALLVSAAFGEWLAVTVLGIGIAVHTALWLKMYVWDRRRALHPHL